MALPQGYEVEQRTLPRLNLKGYVESSTITGRLVNVNHTHGMTLAVISVKGQAFMLPIEDAKEGEIHRLMGLPVEVRIGPGIFSRGVSRMGSHLLNRGRFG